MLKSYKYRIYPNTGQLAMIEKTFNICRLIYNLGLEVKKTAWQSAQKNVSSFDLHKQLPELIEAFPWIGEVDSQATRWAILNLEKAFSSFFNGNGFPKFKKKFSYQSFGCPYNTRRIDWEKSTLTIPKIKDIPIVLSRRFSGQIKTITVSKTPTGKYFASVLVEDGKEPPQRKNIDPSTTTGIDVGIKSFVVTSDGRSFAPNRYLKASLERLKCLQRRASRKKKGSNNRKKANLCVSKLHEKVHNQRVDYCHNITTGLIRDNQTETFVIEDLAVVNMLKNRKLSQAISDVGFGEFLSQLKYKAGWAGKNIITIGRFEPSSKSCSYCGVINETLALSDREWTCDNCGATHDRDLNAAKNIRRMGLEKYAREGVSGEPVESRRLRRAKKQEYNKLIINSNCDNA